MKNREVGLKVFRKFYDWQKVFYGTKVKYSFDEFLNLYGKKKESYIENVGSMIAEAEVTDSRLDAAMRSLAKDSNGLFLKNPVQISNYVQSQEAKIDWVDATFFVVKESVKDVASGAESLGSSLIFTGKILNFLLPVIVLVIVFFWVNSKTGNRLVK